LSHREVLPRSIPSQRPRDRVPVFDGAVRAVDARAFLRDVQTDVIRLQVDQMLFELDADYANERVVIVIDPPLEGTSLLAGHVTVRARATPKKEIA